MALLQRVATHGREAIIPYFNLCFAQAYRRISRCVKRLCGVMQSYAAPNPRLMHISRASHADQIECLNENAPCCAFLFMAHPCRWAFCCAEEGYDAIRVPVRWEYAHSTHQSVPSTPDLSIIIYLRMNGQNLVWRGVVSGVVKAITSLPCLPTLGGCYAALGQGKSTMPMLVVSTTDVS